MERRRLFLAALLAGVAAKAGAARAQGAQPTGQTMRVRGIIKSMEGDTLTVGARDGQTVAITLTEPLVVMTVRKAELTDIGPNSYVGTTTRTALDGTMTAVEIRIFPEAMRGAGEGSRPWDLEPGSKMTNGTVTGAVSAASGREITIGYKEGASKVVVPPTAGIMTYVAGARSDLKPGEVVFVTPAKAADGTLTAGRVNVGKAGVAPMM